MADDVYKLSTDFSPVDKAIESATKAFIEMQADVEDSFEKISAAAEKSMAETVKDSVSTATKVGKVLGYDLLSPIKSAWTAMREASRERMEGVKASVGNAFQKINEFFPTLGATASAGFEAVKGYAVTAFTAIQTAATATWAAITGGVSVLTGWIGKAFGMILSPIKAVFSGIVGAAKGVVGFITGTFSRAVGLLKSAFTGVYDIVKELLPLAGIGLFAGLAVGLKELQATEQAFTRVKAAVAATGGVAGFTTEQLKAMADQMAENTRFGDDLALAAQAVALQFKNVRGDVFKQALELSADAAIAWGVDLSSATDKVARALDDPLEGFRLLKSEGVKFNEQQKLMIEQMLRMGNVAGAQKIILDGLRNTVGGQAAADVNTFSGALAQVNNAMGDAWKAIAGALIPALKPLVMWFRDGSNAMAGWAPAVGNAVSKAMEWFESFRPVLNEWITWAKNQFTGWANWIIDKVAMAAAVLQTAIPNAIEFIKTAMKFPGDAWAWVWAEGELAFEKVKNAAFDAFDAIMKKVKESAQPMLNFISDALVDAMDMAESKLNHKLAGMSNEMRYWLGLDDSMTEESATAIDEATAGMRKQERALRDAEQKRGGGEWRDGKFVPTAEDPEVKKVADARAARIKELEDAARNAREQMANIGDFTSPDFQAWQATADMIKEKLKGLLGGGEMELPPELDPTNSNSPFAFNKEAGDGNDSSSAGKFEDLLSLQKRIAGAASTTSPETKELSKQTAFMLVAHKETIHKLDEVVKKPAVQLPEQGLGP